jgi:hypothetical protein
MFALSLLLLTPAADPDDGLAKRMLPVNVREAGEYTITVESAPTKPLELKKEPVFECLNPARSDQQGSCFVWLRDGRPAAFACIFSVSRPQYGGRLVYHELHALDPEKLVVNRDALNEWKPQTGVARTELPDAAAPAESAGARLIQMRRLAQEFAGHSVDRDRNRFELRLLPTPLYRYPAAQSGVIDGALFALVSPAGTDPEVLLALEATAANGKTRWQYACGRFSNFDLHVERKGKELFSSIRSATNAFAHDALHLYRIYPDKVVSPEGKLLARVRQAAGGPQIVPFEGK